MDKENLYDACTHCGHIVNQAADVCGQCGGQLDAANPIENPPSNFPIFLRAGLGVAIALPLLVALFSSEKPSGPTEKLAGSFKSSVFGTPQGASQTPKTFEPNQPSKRNDRPTPIPVVQPEPVNQPRVDPESKSANAPEMSVPKTGFAEPIGTPEDPTLSVKPNSVKPSGPNDDSARNTSTSGSLSDSEPTPKVKKSIGEMMEEISEEIDEELNKRFPMLETQVIQTIKLRNGTSESGTLSYVGSDKLLLVVNGRRTSYSFANLDPLTRIRVDRRYREKTKSEQVKKRLMSEL